MEKLVKQILSLLTKSKKRTWPDDWGLKLISLFFAIFLWYFVVGEDKVDVNLLIPVEIVNLPRDLVISNQYKKELDVTVSGSRGLIRGMSRQNMTKTVDLSNSEPGTIVIRNTPDSLNLPRGIRVMRIQPTHLIFILDRLIQREEKIKPVVTGSVPEGYELVSIELEPDSITLNGPNTVIGDQKFLETEDINVNNITSTEVRQVHLNLKPELAELIGESIVTAKITVRQKMDSISLPKVPITIMNPMQHAGYFIDPPTASVDITLPEELRKKEENPSSLVSLHLDVEKLSLGRHTIPIEHSTQNGVVIRRVSPPQVQVDVSRVIEPNKVKIERVPANPGQ